MSASFTQYINEIYLTSQTMVKHIEMKIRGGFTGEVMGNVNVKLKHNYLKIQILDNVIAEPFIVYSGDTSFYEIKCYDENEKRIQSFYEIKNDEWQNVSLVWSVANDKYEDISATNRYEEERRTRIFYANGNREYFTDAKGFNLLKIQARKEYIKELENLRSKNALRK